MTSGSPGPRTPTAAFRRRNSGGLGAPADSPSGTPPRSPLRSPARLQVRAPARWR